MLSKILLPLVGALSVASAQQSAWGQCGGTGWTGATTCVSGYSCIVMNAYYSQCTPSTGSGSSSGASTTAKTTLTTAKSTTSKASPTTTAPSTPKSTGIKYLISFGDSYSQTGFDPTSTLPSANDLLGNPPFPGYTTTNGPNWIGFYITQFNSSPVYSYNFAYGGATTDASLVAPYEPTVLSFIDQVTQYETGLKTTPNFAPWTSSNSLFAVWMGVNDVGNGWYQSNWSTTLDAIMTQYINQTQTLYNSGARNFLFLTVPPIQLTPNVAAQGASVQAQEATAIAQYNNALTSKIAAFKAANAGVTTYVLNTTTSFMTAINNPTAYGAPNANCYNGDGVSCLWFNDYHPGQAIHKLLAQALATLLGKW